MKIRITIAVFICAVFFVGILLRMRAAPQNTGTIEDARKYATSLLDSKSPKDAFAQFKKRYEGVGISQAHTAAHAFGELLYTKAGVDGFSACDATFGFGCFHTFIPAAISDKGTDVIQELDAACIKAFGAMSLGCFHGIGHGLLAYEGYTVEGVKKSLSLCKTLSWKRTYGGCPEGVFMEYDFRTTIADPSKQLRPFSSATRYSPCDSVDRASRVDCYFSIPSWWDASLKSDSNRYSLMGSYCSAISNSDQRRGCFRGIGYAIATPTNYNAAEGIRACEAAQKGGIECREGLAWALYAIPTFRSSAETVCTDGLSEKASATCKDEYLFVIK